MSGGLAPSRSTLYVGNLPFTLTNNDLHKIFEKFGKVVKVTVLKDKVTRDSKGVAFIQYLDRPSAINACKAVNKKELFGRRIKCVIATDNGRSAEFIRKRTYPDKSRCYECGEFGHVSYSCSKNVLGEREPPPKKEKKKSKGKKKSGSQFNWDDDDECCSDDDDNQGEDLRESSLSYAIQMNALMEEENEDQAAGETSVESSKSQKSRKKFKKSAYFSDEEEVEDG